jgi:hypothetical protein
VQQDRRDDRGGTSEVEWEEPGHGREMRKGEFGVRNDALAGFVLVLVLLLVLDHVAARGVKITI